MKRSHAPVFWLLFGAGGMLAALAGTALVLVTGIAVPLGIGAEAMSHARMLAFAQNALGKAFAFAVIMLFACHAAHRILCTLHDVGIRKGPVAKTLCYGAAAIVSVVAGVNLLRIGF